MDRKMTSDRADLITYALLTTVAFALGLMALFGGGNAAFGALLIAGSITAGVYLHSRAKGLAPTPAASARTPDEHAPGRN